MIYFLFLLQKGDTFGIIMIMQQILLNIMHVGSIKTYVISDAVRRPGHVLTIIRLYNPASGHIDARLDFSLF
jgi:hypothetical protein